MTDDDLRDLLSDAVSDVEPHHRLDAIRARTRPRPRHRWVWVAAGGAVASTAVVTALLMAPGDGGSVPAVAPSSSGAPDWYASEPTSEPESPPNTNPTRAVALYFVGDTPAGPRLFREFRQVPYDNQPDGDFEDPTVFASVLHALETVDDPDYRTEVDLGNEVGAEVIEGELRVYLDDARPSDLSLQQMALSLTAATGGVPMSWQTGPDVFSLDPDRSVLADVSISDPVEGRTVHARFTARGVANSPEGNVPWRVEDATGDVVLEGFATAAGSIDRLYPWETEIDVSGLAPGTYTFVASTDDPSGGTEGFGPTSDTRTIVVE